MKAIVYVLIYSGIYILLGNARSVQANPMIEDAILAVNMIVPIIAGIIHRYKVGAGVGFVGTTVNALITQSPFEFASIIGHTVMGALAGINKLPLVPRALMVTVGHAINVLIFVLIGIMPFALLATTSFYIGLVSEIAFDVVAIVAIVMILKFVGSQGVRHGTHT